MSKIWLARLARSAGSSAFDGTREVRRDGLPQETPGGTTIAEVLENWLYPAEDPQVSLSVQGGEGAKQFGETDLDITLAFTVTKGGYDIASIKIGDSDELEDGSGDTQSGTYETSVDADTDTTFTITVEDSEGNTVTATATVTFYYAMHYGVSELNHTELITDLASNAIDTYSFSKALATEKTLNENYNCTGGRYIHVLYPAAWGDPNSVKTGVFDFSDYTVENVTIEDEYGESRSYKLFSVNNRQTGSSVNINILS